MGLDSSTQGVKTVIIDPDQGSILASDSVNYGKELGEKYESPEGVLPNKDPLIKHSNPLMWVEALEMLFEKIKKKRIPLDEIKAISGCGQQHGSVYLNNKFDALISSPPKGKDLYQVLGDALSRKSSPIWMDSSTGEQCRILSEKIGTEEIRRRSGSAPVERFTGPQIMKFYQSEPNAYANTSKIHLVSSFICSVLCGKSAPIDFGDGSGMNIMNLQTLKWDDELCSAVAKDLKRKLPSLAPATSIVGEINPYFLKYGFSKDTEVTVWTGDNPASLVGSGASGGSVAVISLGTSDTFFSAMKKPLTDPDGCGHVFGNPAGGFMSLICFKNGSLAREKIKAECGVDWDFFGGAAFQDTIPGGGTDNIMVAHFFPEITPLRINPKLKFSGSEDFTKGKADKALKIRAIVESQMLAIKLHSAWMGEKFKTIRITGGGSKSKGICQTAADVFGSSVETISIPDSAALGAAMIAASSRGYDLSSLSANFAKPTGRIEPNPNNTALYDRMLEKYRELEREDRV